LTRLFFIHSARLWNHWIDRTEECSVLVGSTISDVSFCGECRVELKGRCGILQDVSELVFGDQDKRVTSFQPQRPILRLSDDVIKTSMASAFEIRM
jgi:hypothetical protein